MIFLGESGDWAAGAFVRVCLAGRAANAGFAAAAGAGCAGCAGCASWIGSLDFAGAARVVRFDCGAGFVVLAARVGSGSAVSALFDRVARLVAGSGSSWICGGPANSSSWSMSVFFERVALVLVAGCDCFDAVAAVAAVARLTGFFRSARLSF